MSFPRRRTPSPEPSPSATSEPVQPININMSAVELAPIEATGTTTPSSGLYRSSTALSQLNHPHSSLQSVGGGSEAEAEQHVEADGACTSSSGSSHPSTSSAQEGGGTSTSGVNPSRKRSWTAASCTSVHPEVSESQLGLSISNNTTNAVNDTMVGTSVPPTLQVAVQLPLPLVQASRPATTTEPEYYLSLSECRMIAVRFQPLAVRVDPITRYHQFRPVDQPAFHMRHINIDMMAVELPHVSAIRDATPSTGSSSTSPSTSKARVPAAMQYTRPSVKRVEIAAEVESNVQRTNDEMDELNWQHALLTTTSSRTTTVTTYKRDRERADFQRVTGVELKQHEIYKSS